MQRGQRQSYVCPCCWQHPALQTSWELLEHSSNLVFLLGPVSSVPSSRSPRLPKLEPVFKSAKGSKAVLRLAEYLQVSQVIRLPQGGPKKIDRSSSTTMPVAKNSDPFATFSPRYFFSLIMTGMPSTYGNYLQAV
jgi:hypothetical protein